jgi:hypothetical protein
MSKTDETNSRLDRLEHKVDRLEHKVDRIQDDMADYKQELERFATKEELRQELERFRADVEERFATKEDLERFADRNEREHRHLYALLRQEMWHQRRELSSEMASHFGAMEERMTHLFDVVVEAINSKLSLSEAEKIFVKRSELPPGLVPQPG